MSSQKPSVIFCLPGNSFSGRFLDGWSELLGYCMKNNIPFRISRQSSCNIYYCRNICLGADVIRGENQKPFDGKLDYTHLMWLDSDIIFTPQQFQALLDHDKDIVSGIYMMEGGRQFATVIDWDKDFFEKHGYFEFLTPKDLEGRNELFEVNYTGFGFMLIKKGVFESLTYPWFRPIDQKIGDMVDFTTEDVAFCLMAREKGHQIWVDPKIRVGHEKTVVL